MPTPTPVLAVSEYTKLAVRSSILGVLATPLLAYGVWENLPLNQGTERWLNAEFYAGGYPGAAFTPSQDLFYYQFALNSPDYPRLVRGRHRTLLNNQFAHSLVGGVKFGYFTQRIPYLGLEGESCLNNG